MAKTSKKTTQSKRKNKLHLKKSARWTIAGLMLATAVIIALIPVQGDGVFAISENDKGPFAVTPELDTIVKKPSETEEGYGLFSDEDMSVNFNTDSDEYKGFPIRHKGDIEPHELVIIDSSEDDAAAIQIDMSPYYSYEMRDKNNNIITQGDGEGQWNKNASDKFFILAEKLPSSESDKSIFKMRSTEKNGHANVVTEYVGGKNGYITDGVVSLDDGTVGYSNSDWDYEYRQLKITRYQEAVDENNEPMGIPDVTKVAYEETFLVCTNRATVQYIADEAFKNSDPDNPANIVNLTLPENLLRIGNRAFQGQSNIVSINGGQSLKNIGKMAFEGCSSLNTVSFNEITAPLENVGDGAFANCTALSNISFPNTTTVIGSGAFYGCKSLNDSTSDAVSEDDSMIFSRTKGSETSMKLGNYVFAGCENLTNIALDKDITEIGKGVFADCPSLKTVVLPGKDNTINYSADTFANDNNLVYVRIPDDDTSSIFKNSDGKEDMSSKPCIFVTPINQEQNTDKNNSSEPITLEPITMKNEYFSIWGPKPEITSNIHKYAQTYGITYMYEKDGIIYYELTLNGYTFSFNQEGIITGCICAEGIEQEKNLSIPPSIGGVDIVGIAPEAFSGFKPTEKNDEEYPDSITIPDNIKTIGDKAFYNCDSIVNVYINTSGVDIGESAFAECDKLENIKFTQVGDGNGETYIGDNCFYNDKKLEVCAFRNTDLNRDDINVVNVKSIGTNAFRTGNDNGLTIVGDMRTDYVPYNFAIEPRNKTSAGSNSYITYKTGNPQNLVCRYDTTLGDNSVIDPEYGVIDGKVRLVSYPVADTVVGSDGTDDITIHDLQEKIDQYNADPDHYPQPSVMEIWIVDKMKNIALPEGIVTITKSKSDNKKTTVGNILMSQLNEPSDAKENIGGTYVECDNMHALESVTFDGIKEIPSDSFKNDNNLKNVTLNGEIDEIGNEAFAGCDRLETINVGSSNNEIKSIGENAFGGYEESYVPGKRTMYDCCDKLKNVVFLGNISDSDLTSNVFYGAKELTTVSLLGDEAQGKENATKEDPYYWCEDGVIYKYDGSDTILVECLPGVAQTSIRSDINDILPGAFENCDKLAIVDLSNCTELYEIPERCFFDCDSLKNVTLSKTCSSIGEMAFACDYDNNIARATPLDVTMLSHEIYLDRDSFKDREALVEGATPLNTVHSYDKTAAQRYTNKMPNVNFESDVYDDVLIRFVYYKDNEPVIDENYWPYKSVPKAPDVPVDGRLGYEFTGTWNAQIVEATEFKQYTAQYKAKENSTTGDSTKPSTTTPSNTGNSGTSPNSTNKSTSSSSSSTNKSSSASSTNNRPVVISGAPTPVVQPGSANSSTSGGAASNSPSGSNVTTGNTNVVSTAPGLSNNGKMSATVNGSSDNYVIKLTETAEADECAKQALSAAFGSLDNIRYMPFDISLYDSTGTQKISPVPEGVTVSVTMPIPDSLQVYGGNNKVASTVGGTLEAIKPRFTVIDGVPCMNFTVSHLSPYVIYVDTANLTASGTLDATPKTGDPIHPKWFLCIGLTAISIFLFLKRDKDTLRAA